MIAPKIRRRTIAAIAGTAAAVLLLPACSSTDSSSSSSSSASSSAAGATLPGAEDVQTAMKALTADGKVPGVIAVVQTPDQSGVLTEGKANLTTGAAMTPDAALRIASVSKAFNGAVILSLVSQGKLSLDAKLATLLPTAPASWGEVTLGQILQHTSGLPDYIKSQAFIDEFIKDPKAPITPEQLIGYVADQPPAFAPGSQYLYSDTDNIVAGLVAEKASGKPYTTLLDELVGQPLALKNTSLPDTVALPEGFIHGYSPADTAADTASPAAASTPMGPEDVSQVINPTQAWASGGMISTMNDLNTFVRGYVGGKLFDSTVRKQQMQFVPGAGGPPGPGTNSSGLSIYRYETACGTFFGHTGNMPGYTVFIASDEAGQRSVTVAINAQVTPKGDEATFNKLLAVENAALCSANGGASQSASTSGDSNSPKVSTVTPSSSS